MPYAALDMVEKELQRLQQQCVIEPTNGSQLAAAIVVVKKQMENVLTTQLV